MNLISNILSTGVIITIAIVAAVLIYLFTTSSLNSVLKESQLKVSEKTIKWGFVAGSTILLFLLWDWIKVVFANWFASSDAGETFGLEATAVADNLWWVVLIALIGGAVIFRRGNKESSKGLSGGLVILALVIGGLVLISLFNKYGLDSDLNKVSSMQQIVSCTKQETIDHRIEKPIRVVFCPGQGSLNLFTHTGMRPVIRLDPAFVREYGAVLPQNKNQALRSFIKLKRAMAAQMFILEPTKTMKVRNGWIHSGFDVHNLEYVILIIDVIGEDISAI